MTKASSAEELLSTWSLKHVWSVLGHTWPSLKTFIWCLNLNYFNVKSLLMENRLPIQLNLYININQRIVFFNILLMELGRKRLKL